MALPPDPLALQQRLRRLCAMALRPRSPRPIKPRVGTAHDGVANVIAPRQTIVAATPDARLNIAVAPGKAVLGLFSSIFNTASGSGRCPCCNRQVEKNGGAETCRRRSSPR